MSNTRTNKKNSSNISNHYNDKKRDYYFDSKKGNNICMNDDYNSKFNNKLKDEYNDTDAIIKRVADRFKETQKLLNDFLE